MGSSPPGDPISGIDLTDDQYTVVQSLIRNKYKAMDAAGNVVLRSKQKMLKMKEEFPFTDGDGNEVFTVKAGRVLDVAGDYSLIDSATGQEVVLLDEEFNLFVENWRIRDPDTNDVIAEITSQNKLLTILRYFVGVLSLIPHSYEITDADGNHVGTIAGKFSLKDTYVITIDDASTVPKEAVIAAAMVIDALEDN